MTGENGGGRGESQRLAPVIPLFGGAKTSTTHAEGAAAHAEDVVPRRTGAQGLWKSTWDDPGVSSENDADAGSPSARHPARGGARPAAEVERPRLRAVGPHAVAPVSGAEADDEGSESPERVREAAEEALVRKLRTRSLSVSEARTVLRGHSLDSSQIDDVIDDFCRRGYLDDRVLADLLVTAGAQRKGQGRVALSRALSQRGLSRDVIDAALTELPDDDAERALEYARSKASSLARFDFDTALRRLVGQLSRRGYNGGVAMSAARTALNENSRPKPSSGVRFVDSD